MKKILMIFMSAMLIFCAGCEKKEEKKAEKFKLPKEYSYEDKENSELIPNGTTEEHGDVEEAFVEDDLPSEDELGEYTDILMEGDQVDDSTRAGWVLAISVKDITVNTNNKITKYKLIGDGKNCVDHVKPGDAVLMNYVENDDGSFSAYYVGRVRVEDKPLSKDDIAGYAPNNTSDEETEEP